jgi:hypothetical protein
MKLLTVLLISLSIIFSITGRTQETIFSNGCSGLPAGWTNDGSQESGYYLITDGEYVISPSYDLTGYSGLQLTSNLRSYGSGTAPECTIEISNDGGSTWSWGSIIFSDIPNVYTDFVWDIGTVSGSSVKFRWFKSDGTRDLRVNDLVLTGNLTGPTPMINANPEALSGFSYTQGNGPSNEQSFSVSGTDLTNDILISAPVHYEVSQMPGSGYTNSITLTQSGGTVSSTTIYTRLKSGFSQGTYNEDITISSAGATDVFVSVNGSVYQTAATTVLPYNESFDTDLGDCYVYSVSGSTKEWIYTTDTGNGFAEMNGYNSGDTEEDWIILPGINLDDYSDESMTFDTWYRYGSDDANNYLKLFYSTNYPGTGDPSGFNWTELSFTHPSSTEVWTGSGTIDLSAVTGTSVFIGFKYRYEPGKYRKWRVDNISVEEPPVINPGSFTATPVSSSAIDLLWTLNGANDNVMVAWSTDGNFGTPANGSNYNPGSTITGGGTVIYNGNGTSFSHTGLNPLTHYFYKAWSVDGNIAYSQGVTDDTFTFAHEPDNHPTNLVASTNTESEITVSWTDAPATEHYLLKGADDSYSTIVNPVDGTPENNSLLVQNVDQGIETHTFINLNSGTRYYFKIFSYNGTGNLVNYKTDNVPQADAETKPAYVPNIFISEYIEGSSLNKAIEIYNGESQPVDLSKITINLYSNGAVTPTATWTGTGTLETGATYVLSNSSAGSIIANKSQANSGIADFNGNDALTLLYNSVVIDKIGVVGESTEWSVAGISSATKDHTLVRKLSVTTGNTDWNSSAGTDENNSEWIVFNQDHFYNLGIFGTGWSGLTDSDWNTAGNWDVRIPVSTTDALINGFVTTMPGINNDGASPAECNDLIIEPNAVVTINPSKAMTVSGEITGNGSLLIKSDATGTGSLIENTGVTANVERYLEQEKWHFVSAPVDNANTGIFAGLYLKYWDEPDEIWKSVLSPDSTLATDMQGYEIWSDDATSGNTTITYSGLLNSGSKTISLTNTPGTTNATDYSGFNLVGNPYPSAVNWNKNDGSGWTRTNIDMTFWVWNPDAGNYGSYTKGNPAGTNSVDSIIPSQQGFFVKCNNTSGGSLSVDNTARVHSAKNILKSNKATNQYLTLKVQGNNYSDEIIVNINENASIGYDPTLDGVKLFGIQDAPQIYVVTPDSYELSVTSLPLSNNLTIPVNLEAGTNGIYLLKCDNISGFEDFPVYVEDLQEQKITKVTQDFTYTFFASPDDEAARFLIHFSNDNASGIEENNSELTGVSVYSYNKTIYINSKEKISGQIRVIDMLGMTLHSENINESAFIRINMKDKNGYFLVHLLTDKGIKTGKVFICN